MGERKAKPVTIRGIFREILLELEVELSKIETMKQEARAEKQIIAQYKIRHAEGQTDGVEKSIKVVKNYLKMGEEVGVIK